MILQSGGASAQTTLKADAAPDQSVSGNPATVAFAGSANVKHYACNWYNQWSVRRATDNCSPTFDVYFGKNPKPGAKRTFKLEATDLATGMRATDRMTVTLSKSAVAPQRHHFSGQVYIDGALAPPGGILIADIGGSTFGQTTIGDNGQYSIDVHSSNGGGRTIEWLYSAEGQECCLVSTTVSTFTAGRTDTLDLTFLTSPDVPAQGHTITGTYEVYELWGCGGSSQDIVVGKLDDGRWYIRSQGVGEDCMWGAPASVQCYMGEHWEKIIDGVRDSEGCAGFDSAIGDMVVLVGDGGWIISDRNTYQEIAKLTPRSPNNLWALVSSSPLPGGGGR